MYFRKYFSPTVCTFESTFVLSYEKVGLLSFEASKVFYFRTFESTTTVLYTCSTSFFHVRVQLTLYVYVVLLEVLSYESIEYFLCSGSIFNFYSKTCTAVRVRRAVEAQMERLMFRKTKRNASRWALCCTFVLSYLLFRIISQLSMFGTASHSVHVLLYIMIHCTFAYTGTN